MTAKDDLLNSLSQEKEWNNVKGPEIQAEWLRSLTVLFRQITAWLSESVARGLLKVEEIPVEVVEERLGRYDAPSLKILTPRGAAIHITPKARLVVGAFGRVDFNCSPKRAQLVRHKPGQWQFAELRPDRGGWSFKDLTEETFWETLQDLLS